MFLALFRNGGFGFNGDGACAATQGIETQAQLNAIRTQLQDNQNANCIKSAIQGYDGMIFCRWTADAIGKAISINWEKFV